MSKISDKNKLLNIFLISRIPLLIFLIIELFLKRETTVLNFYDAEHYLWIAKFGYTKDYLYAFFPLYPILIKTFSSIFFSYQIAGLIISNVCSFLSLIIFNKLIPKDYKNKKIIIFLFSPILVFTSIIYTESLFIFLCIFTYYLYKKNRYLLTSIFAGLTILTRNSGFILLLVIGIDIFYHKCFKKDLKINIWLILFYGFLACLIGSFYPLYLHSKTGSLFTFMTVQNTNWGRINMSPIGAIIQDIKHIINNKYNLLLIYTVLLNWFSYFYGIILGIKIFKKDLVAGLFLLLSILTFSISFRDINIMGTISSASLFRYVWGLFPIYLYLNVKKEKMLWLLIFISIYNFSLFFLHFFLA